MAPDLPPGQRAVEGFPRFGVNRNAPPPAVPDDLLIEVRGDDIEGLELRATDLATLPRKVVTADHHCVAGWSALDLTWEGVAFRDAYRFLLEPRLRPGARIGYVVLGGLDGYRSILTLDDALGPEVLLADRLDGRPLDGDHGAPLRLVSPLQYGYVGTKHLCVIELSADEPAGVYHRHRGAQRALRLVRPHRRARVWREERRRHLPGRLVRGAYRRLVPLPAPLLTFAAGRPTSPPAPPAPRGAGPRP